MRSLLVIALALTFTAACEDINRSCNAMYAPDMLTVTLDGDLAEGAYVVELSDADLVVTCTFSIDSTLAEPDALCEGTEIDFDIGDDGAITELRVWDWAPAEVEIVIGLDDVELHSETLVPSYDVDEPNGKGCGERSYATEVVSIP